MGEISETRKDINKKLKKEFDILHTVISNMVQNEEKLDSECLKGLIRCHIDLAMQIIREERALHGDTSYLMPPYRPI